MSSKKSYFINLENNQSNITSSVIQMKNASDYEILLELVIKGIASPDDLMKIIVFTNSIQKTLNIMKFLQENLPSTCAHHVNIFHALWLMHLRNCIFEWFWHGLVKILVATKAVGMVSALFFTSS